MKIRDSLAECESFNPTHVDIPNFCEFRYMTEEEVETVIKSMPTKSCECDCIPTKLLKELLPKLLPGLTKIVNLSLQTGHFAKEWKIAIIRPLLKKQGLDLTLSNYRPLSNLPFISKLVEKCMLLQFNKHCNEYCLLPDYQSAYRQNFSCETALVKFVNDMLWSMERQRITAVVAIDLSAAFDTVDHDTLISVLNARFGITDVALVWFKNYLDSHYFKVNVGEIYSTRRELGFSVPQGSCAGPVLYSAYASTMQDIVPDNVDIHGYADDHALKLSFDGKSRTEESQVITQLQECSKSIKIWMDQNRLRMNSSKTEFIMVGSRQHLSKVSTTTIDVNGDLIERSSSVKYLGVDIDERLSFKQHIKRKCRTAIGNFHRLKKIRKTLTQQAASVLACGLILSHLNYGNALFVGLPNVDIAKLQRIQNMTAKLVTQANKYDSVTQAIKSLHWLPIHLRIKYKILILVFKCLSGDAPLYLQSLIKEHKGSRSGLRSGSKLKILEVPFTKLKTFAERSFSVAGPKLWNELPCGLRTEENFHVFKKSLKTYLFDKF